jgi:hypothetical protein
MNAITVDHPCLPGPGPRLPRELERSQLVLALEVAIVLAALLASVIR